MELWHPSLGQRVRDLGEDSLTAVSPNGDILASHRCASRNRGCETPYISLRKMDDGSPIATLRGHTDQVRSLAFSQDGRILASSAGRADGSIRLWDVPSGRQLEQLLGGPRDLV